nr:chromosome segregation protein SMC [Saprospiraceae bacterium]
MRLKKIELKGFKSFGQPTTLHFSEDVTGIVGPNGSGKSNIVDAFRWVLGEQRTTGLRLDKMSDVLFNGSKSRKPANACSVNLVFENDKGILPSEYREVEIARHLYRNGNSEYRLNGVVCRLKDIVSILADTGIASNSYAIIALDMVDDILQDKDFARRKMFEQAAGISKFKRRRKEVENKLRSSEMDLERVQDLLFEIEQNLKQLEKQAKKARSFNKVKNQYREKSILLAKLNILHLRESNHKIKDQLRDKKMELSELQSRRSKLEAEIQSGKQKNLAEEEQLNASQKQAAKVANDLRELENERDLNTQAIANLRESNTTKLSRIEELNQNSAKLSERLEYLATTIESEKALEAQLKEILDGLRDQKEAADTHADSLMVEHDSLETEMHSLHLERNELDKAIVVLQNRIEGINLEFERLGEEEVMEKKRNSELEEKLQELSVECREAEDEIAVLQKKEENRKDELAASRDQREKLEGELKLVERRLDARKNERDLLKSMLEKLEGYPESIKFLNNKKEWSRYAALLTDLIYCPDEYRPAVEAVLEPWLDHYVVPGWKVAKEGLSLLQDAQKGKAQFLLQDGFSGEDTLKTGKVQGMTAAVEVVQIDSAYNALFNYLLKDVFICETGDVPDQLPYKGAVVVSKKGDVVRRSHTAEGGSSDLFAGKKIGRKKALELLNKKISEDSDLVQKRVAELRQIRVEASALEHDQFLLQIKKLESTLGQLKAREAGIHATQTSTEETFLRRKNRMDALRSELEKLKDELKAKKSAEEQVQLQLKSMADKTGDSSAKVQEAIDMKTRHSERYNRANIEWIQQQNKVSGYVKEMDFQRGRLEEYGREKNNLVTQVENNEVKIEALRSSVKQAEADIAQWYEKKKALEGVLDEREQSYFSARNTIFELEKALSEVNREFQQLQSVIEQFREKDQEVEWSVRAITERLSVEFNLEVKPDQSLSLSEEEREHPREELEKKVDRLKNRLSSFGDVNPLALEAFDEMKLRYEEIHSQKRDIEEARDSLQKTIEEIETTAKERFLEAFEKVRFNFIHVFRSLFTEDDNCDLVLSNREDPLESEVEIIAKPKGKRPQSIAQLSGGEKTLTAISLLFALYLLKPAPFCIFDEVDAPLDDSNIEKFNRIIKQFSEESQFIIVTHNKQTMTHLDVIYGVYMEETGVSGVSAVDFRALENEDFLTEVKETKVES